MIPTIALGTIMLITWAAAVWASYQDEDATDHAEAGRRLQHAA